MRQPEHRNTPAPDFELPPLPTLSREAKVINQALRGAQMSAWELQALSKHRYLQEQQVSPREMQRFTKNPHTKGLGVGLIEMLIPDESKH